MLVNTTCIFLVQALPPVLHATYLDLYLEKKGGLFHYWELNIVNKTSHPEWCIFLLPFLCVLNVLTDFLFRHFFNHTCASHLPLPPIPLHYEWIPLPLLQPYFMNEYNSLSYSPTLWMNTTPSSFCIVSVWWALVFEIGSPVAQDGLQLPVLLRMASASAFHKLVFYLSWFLTLTVFSYYYLSWLRICFVKK